MKNEPIPQPHEDVSSVAEHKQPEDMALELISRVDSMMDKYSAPRWDALPGYRAQYRDVYTGVGQSRAKVEQDTDGKSMYRDIQIHSGSTTMMIATSQRRDDEPTMQVARCQVGDNGELGDVDYLIEYSPENEEITFQGHMDATGEQMLEASLSDIDRFDAVLLDLVQNGKWHPSELAEKID